jgi:hypothetical protein
VPRRSSSRRLTNKGDITPISNNCFLIKLPGVWSYRKRPDAQTKQLLCTFLGTPTLQNLLLVQMFLANFYPLCTYQFEFLDCLIGSSFCPVSLPKLSLRRWVVDDWLAPDIPHLWSSCI